MKPFKMLRMRQMAGGGGGGDPSFASVVLLMHMDGSNGSTTFTDQIGHTFTGSGGVALSTMGPKFGTASLDLDGVNDYISTPTSTDWDYGSGDFTAEAWAYIAGSYQRGSIFHRGSGADFYIEINASGIARAVMNGGGITMDGATSLTQNAWHHIALSRNGSSLNLYADGALEATFSIGATSLSAPTDPLRIGADVGNGRYYLGRIDEARITKGVGRYPAAFTVPAAAFPNS